MELDSQGLRVFDIVGLQDSQILLIFLQQIDQTGFLDLEVARDSQFRRCVASKTFVDTEYHSRWSFGRCHSRAKVIILSTFDGLEEDVRSSLDFEGSIRKEARRGTCRRFAGDW